MSPKAQILIVDDEPDIVEGARMWLEAAGYSTNTARNGVDGVKQAKDHPPDAIVLDVRMPKKDGLRVLTDLRDRPETRNIPVVMLSASLVDQQRTLEAGARFFLRKPYTGKDLVAAIDGALN